MSNRRLEEKKQNGTIFKVPPRDFLTKEELDFLWSQHNAALKEFDQPKERYTRFLSDLIKRFRDISFRLIESGAIPGYETKDTAFYVRKQLQQKEVPLNNHYYEYFSPDQKREWQSDVDKKINSNHQHSWQNIGTTPLGEIKRCGGGSDSLCGAIMIDGKTYEYIPEDPQESEPKQKKLPPIVKEECWPIIEAFQQAANNLYDFAGALKKNTQLLTAQEIQKLKSDVFLMKKAGEFLTKTATNKKQIIDPFSMHLLALAYGQATQKVAAGLFIMYRIDLAERKYSEGVRYFKDISEFAKLISEKQTKKAMEGKIREINERYEPINPKKAQDQGFSGQRCENCHSLRVGYDRIENTKFDKDKDPLYMKHKTELWCYSCLTVPKKKTFDLPKQSPTVSVEWNS